MDKVPALKGQSGGGESQRANDKYICTDYDKSIKEIHWVLKKTLMGRRK